MSLVVIRVADLEASRRFYERIGLVLRPEQHGAGPRHLSADLGGVVLELYPLASGAATAGARLGFRVASPDRIAATLGPAVVGRFDRDGQPVVVAKDPDGHTIELTADS